MPAYCYYYYYYYYYYYGYHYYYHYHSYRYRYCYCYYYYYYYYYLIKQRVFPGQQSPVKISDSHHLSKDNYMHEPIQRVQTFALFFSCLELLSLELLHLYYYYYCYYYYYYCYYYYYYYYFSFFFLIPFFGWSFYSTGLNLRQKECKNKSKNNFQLKKLNWQFFIDNSVSVLCSREFAQRNVKNLGISNKFGPKKWLNINLRTEQVKFGHQLYLSSPLYMIVKYLFPKKQPNKDIIKKAILTFKQETQRQQN